MSNPMMTIIKPCLELRKFVRYYWVLESNEHFNILTFPIGCHQIIIHRRSPLFVPELSSSQDRFTISGQVNSPANISSDSDIEMIARYIYTGLQGGSIMKGWMRDENTMITCCNDGTILVIFKIERIDYD